MDQTVVTATQGRKLGSRSSRRLRAEGKLPGVVYGLGRDPITVTLTYNELRDAMKGKAGMNTVLQLDVDGGEQETVVVRSVQRDPIKRTVTHADFLRVDPSIPINVKVPITLTGEPNQVLDEGGLIEQNLFDLEVEVSPMSIPSEIEVDISAMTLDTRIAVGDLSLPSGVTSLLAEDIAVVSPVIPRAAAALEEEEAADEDALDGEEGEGDEGGDDDASADSSEGEDE